MHHIAAIAHPQGGRVALALGPVHPDAGAVPTNKSTKYDLSIPMNKSTKHDLSIPINKSTKHDLSVHDVHKKTWYI